MRRAFFAASFFTLFISAVSCIYPYNPEIQPSHSECLVVEGDIVAGDYSRFKLSLTSGLSDTVSAPIFSVRDFVVEYSDGQSVTGQYSAGCYCADTRSLTGALSARLHFTVLWKGGSRAGQEHTYTTDWLTVSGESSIDSLSYVVSDDRSRISVLCSASAPSENGYYRWYFDEKYQYYAYYKSDLIFDHIEREYFDRPDSLQIYTCWKDGSSSDIYLCSTQELKSSTLVDHEVYSMDNQQFKLSGVYRVTLHQCLISREAYLYYRSLKNNADDVGGLFSPQPGEAQGNVRCTEYPDEQVIGYVDAVRVSSKSLYISDAITHFYKGRTVCPEYDIDYGGRGYGYYKQGKIPIMLVDDDESAKYWVWGTPECTDCRRRGGVNVRPGDWTYR